MAIKIFLTGGTFDKEYNELDGSLFFKDTHLPEMLALGRNRVPVDISTLMMIDSLFNLGAALAFAQTLQPGVYIAMNGQYFTHDNCRKNKQTGFFETLNTST